MAREMAVQMLYQADQAGSAAPAVVRAFDVQEFLIERVRAEEPATEQTAPGPVRLSEEDRREGREAFDHAATLVRGTRERLEEIDSLIRAQAENWRLERMPPVDRNILRLAVYELLYEPDVPQLVVVDEAVELAKRFGSEQSGRFVNGLLDGLIKRHAFPGSIE
jgi:N utilization substance protein B